MYITYICNACRALWEVNTSLSFVCDYYWYKLMHRNESMIQSLNTEDCRPNTEAAEEKRRELMVTLVCHSFWGIHLELRFSMQKQAIWLVRSSFSKLSCQLVMSSLILWHPSKNQSFWNIVFYFHGAFIGWLDSIPLKGIELLKYLTFKFFWILMCLQLLLPRTEWALAVLLHYYYVFVMVEIWVTFINKEYHLNFLA